MKRKENLQNPFSYLLFILMALSIFPTFVEASAQETYQVTAVKIGSQNAKLDQNKKDPSVYVAENTEDMISRGYTIQMTVRDGVSVTASDMTGPLEVTNESGAVTIQGKTDGGARYGAYACHITVGEGASAAKCTVILSGYSYWGYISETYIGDMTTGEYKYLDENTIIQRSSNEASSYRELEVEAAVKQVSLVRRLGSEGRTHSEKYSPNTDGWLSGGYSYVRINSGDNQDFKRYEASSDYHQGLTFRSPRLSLKKGLNVIETYTRRPNVAVFDQANGDIPEGLSIYGERGYYGAVYLVYASGDEQPATQGSDTSIQYIEATQLGSPSVPMQAYGARKKEDGSWEVVLPKEMPLDKVILGIVPTDPEASVEIVSKDLIKGDTIGSYTALALGGANSSVNSFQVEVTAADGTKATHTIGIVRANPDCELTSFSVSAGQLKSYNEPENTAEFAPDTHMYILQGAALAEDKLTAEYSSTATGAISQKNEYMATYTVTAEDGLHKNNYYFIYQDESGNIPMLSGPSDEQKQKAEQKLTDEGWYSRSDAERQDLESAWTVFMSAATKADMSGGKSSDPQKIYYKQATDYAREILRLILLGYNPYDAGQDHKDLVAGLKALQSEDGLTGGYANNEWTLMALRACGEEIPQGLIDYVRKVNIYDTFSVDMRGWAIAALKGLIPEDELMAGILALKELQGKGGHWGNGFTDGCVMTGIVGAGVNLDFFNVEGKELLDIMASQTMKDPTAGWCKDLVIAYGDIMKGSNVWQRTWLTQEKWNWLIGRAEELVKDNPNNAELKTALENAKKVSNSITGNGKTYYALYDQAAKLDNSLREDVTLGEEQEGLIDMVEGEHYDFKNKIMGKNGWWKTLVIGNTQSRKNGNGRVIYVETPTIEDYSIYTFDYMVECMKKLAKTSSKNRKFFQAENAKGEGIYEHYYLLGLVAGNADMDNYKNMTANTNVKDIGPIKIDTKAPALQIGLSSDNLQTGKEITLNLAADAENIALKATDNASGVWKVECQTADGAEWAVIYDAAANDNVDIANGCGLLEKDLTMPIPDADTCKVRVTDVAGSEAVSTLTLAKAPAFAETPADQFDTAAPADLVWKLNLNGNGVSAVMDGEGELTSGTDYVADTDAGTLTIKKEYFAEKPAADHPFTIKFSRNEAPIDATLTVTVKMIDGNAALAELKQKADALKEINELTLNDETQVLEVKDFYDSLSESMKGKADEATKKRIAEAYDKIQALKVDAQINAIGAVTLDKADQIAKAREAYNALTEAQKAMASPAALTALAQAEATLRGLREQAANWERASQAEAQIRAIGEATLDKEGQIRAARAAYDALTDAQKALVSQDARTALEQAEAALEALKNEKADAAQATALIEAIGEATLEKAQQIAQARVAYEALTEEEKALIAPETLEKLIQAETALKELQTQQADQNAASQAAALIEAIGEATLEKAQQIEDARTAYEALTEAQKALVSPEALEKLTQAEKDLETLRAQQADQEKAGQTAALIEAIGKATLDKEAQIKEARKAYEALTEAQKALVSEEALAALAKAESDLAALKKQAADKAAADAAARQINAIGSVTLNKAKQIEGARNAYEALTADQKKLVSENALNKLAQAEKDLAALRKKEEDKKKNQWKNQNNASVTKGSGKGSKVDAKKDGTASLSAVKATNAKKVTVPAAVTVGNKSYKVTEVNANAFAKAKKATSVTLPKTVKNIKANAFKKNAKLKSVTIKNAGQRLTLQKGAFTGAKSLKKITIQIKKASALTVKKGAFKGLDTRKTTVKVDKKTKAKELAKIRRKLKAAGFKGKVAK